MKDGDVIQVAHVVRDIDKAMRFYWDTGNAGKVRAPWRRYPSA